MYNFTTEAINYVLEGLPVNATVQIDAPSGLIELTGDVILADSFTIDRKASYGDTLNIGCADASEVKFSFRDDDGQFDSVQFEGAQMKVNLIIGNEIVPYGVYIIDQRPGKGLIKDIVALDQLCLTDIPMDWSALTFPITVESLLYECARQSGLTMNINIDQIDNIGYTVTYDERMKDAIIHEVLGWIAGITGSNIQLNANGELEIRYPENTPVQVETDYFPVLELEVGEKNVSITGVKCVEEMEVSNADAEGNSHSETQHIEHLVGTDRFCFDLTDNPLVSHDYDSCLGAILARWGTVTVRPIYTMHSNGLPMLEPMDIFTLKHQGQELKCLITSSVYNVNSLSDIKCAGEPVIKDGYATGKSVTGSMAQAVKTVVRHSLNRETKYIRQDFIDALSRLNNRLIQAMGYYTTTITNEDGSIVTYTHDKPTLEESRYLEYKPGAGDLMWTNTGWNGGNPVWTSGYTVDGSLVMRAIHAAQITADQIDVSGKVLTTLLNEQTTVQQQQQTTINEMGITITQNTTVNGQPVSEMVGELHDNYQAINSQISGLKYGGGNQIMNATYGGGNEATLAFWIRLGTWGELKSRSIKWGKLNTTKWSTVSAGDY